ncbi:hypothetical protein DOY81_003841 [Sarcophaga bullata]|nr:hypothetical protein DOY81_003841 [Sarcophaga bullata]
MLPLQNSSLISSKISKFYLNNPAEQNEHFAGFFNANGTFNANAVVDYIWPGRECTDILKDLQNYTYENYLQCFKKILPIFQHTDNVINTLKDDLKIQWMGKNVLTYLQMKVNYENSNETEIFEHTLILTSLLANALTNVFLTQSQARHAPYLLKDLINSKEIEMVFGLEMVLILKILMGSPNSINLRNIVWHGFPQPLEIPQYYVKVLLVTIHTLGSIIDIKNFQLKERSQILTYYGHLEVLKMDLKCNVFNLEDIKQNIKQLNSDYKPYWLKLLNYYETGNYIPFTILILTQIELLLRLHYGYVNNFDISAKLDEYYITIDTIFETKVTSEVDDNASNKLLDFENSSLEGCFHVLYDIFISPNGCRLRDKVSHGEVALEALDNPQLCSIMLKIFLVLLYPRYYNYFEFYESKLHLNSIAKENILLSVDNIQKFSLKYLENYKENSFGMYSLANKKVLIFKRPKKESELMLLLNKIAININKTIENYKESISVRAELLTQRELHSKRRRTLEKLQTALPDICKTLTLILTTINKLYWLMQNDYAIVLDDQNKCDKTLRFLKHSLSISENFVKYSHYESNEWIKSLELCRKYKEFYEKLFLYDQI